MCGEQVKATATAPKTRWGGGGLSAGTDHLGSRRTEMLSKSGLKERKDTRSAREASTLRTSHHIHFTSPGVHLHLTYLASSFTAQDAKEVISAHT